VDSVAVDQSSEERRIRVLLVEDDFLLRWPTAEYLRDAGYRVIEAATVNEGIVVMSSGTRVDLVFSDINLTGDLTGHALARWLGKYHPDMPMLLTSSDKTASGLISVGATRSFLPKPYDLGEVDRRIRQMLPGFTAA
jgi:two-component system, response regulator PdtaR